jgi:hypothetical protein
MADRFGEKIGPRLADLIGQAVLAARRDHAPIEAQIRQVATQGIIDRMGREVGEHYGPFLRAAIDFHGDQLDPMLRTFLADTASGRHQWKAVSGILAGGASSVLGNVLNNTLAPVAYQLIEHAPQLALDPVTAMSAAARNIVTFADGADAAAKGGFSSDVAQTLYELAQSPPGIDQLLDLMNRGEMSEAEVTDWMLRNGLPASLAASVKQLGRLLLSPADAALGVLRGDIGQAEGEAIARANGMTAGDFTIFVSNTGEPLGLEQLQEAVRRGFIDPARFERGFRQSRYRNEWLDVAEKLFYEPMSTADAVDAAIQGHLSYAEAQAKAVQNGLESGDFDALYQTAGEPLARTEVEELFNRGLMSESAVKQAILESRLKPKYTDLAFALHTRLPEGRQIVAMITHGVVSHDQGVALLLEAGYTQEVAGLLVAEGSATKLGAHKDLTIGEIRSLYTAGVFDQATAAQLLAQLGYDATEADYLTQSWDFLAGAAIVRQAVSVVRSKYIAHKFDEQQANLYLDSLGVSADAKARYLQIWDIELAAVTRSLTEAQIVSAHKNGLIDGPTANTRLLNMGYDADDALILLGVAPGSPVPA